MLVAAELGLAVGFALDQDNDGRIALSGQADRNFDRQAAAAGDDADLGVWREIKARPAGLNLRHLHRRRRQP